MVPFSSPSSAGLPHVPTPPRDDPACLAGRKPPKQNKSRGTSVRLASPGSSGKAPPVRGGLRVAGAYWQVPAGLAVCKTNVSVRQAELNDERMQPIAGSRLRPGRGNGAPGTTDPSRSCAQHMKSPVASFPAAQPALPQALLEAGDARGAEEPPQRPWKAPRLVTNPSALRHTAQSSNVAPWVQLPVVYRPWPAEDF